MEHVCGCWTSTCCARAIRRFIDAHSPDQAERLEETQAKIDSVRVVCGNPRHASYQLAGMLEEQLRTLHDALDRLLALSEELTAALAAFPSGSLKHVLVTDISRDGVLAGPNVALMRSLATARPDLEVQASGGVSSIEDLRALRETGAAAAVVGRALYENRLVLEEAFAL